MQLQVLVGRAEPPTGVSPDLPVVVRDGSAARQRFEAAFDTIRQVFPAVALLHQDRAGGRGRHAHAFLPRRRPPAPADARSSPDRRARPPLGRAALREPWTRSRWSMRFSSFWNMPARTPIPGSSSRCASRSTSGPRRFAASSWRLSLAIWTRSSRWRTVLFAVRSPRPRRASSASFIAGCAARRSPMTRRSGWCWPVCWYRRRFFTGSKSRRRDQRRRRSPTGSWRAA